MDRIPRTEARSPAAFPVPFWLILVGTPVLYFFLIAILENDSPADHPRLLTHAHGMVSYAERPPQADNPRWEWAQLGLSYSRGDSDAVRPVDEPAQISSWWRLDIPPDLQQRAEEWMLLIPRPGYGVIELWVDDRWVSTRGSLHPPHLLPTQSFSIPKSIAPGQAAIYLKIRSERPVFYIPQMYLGPETELLPLAKMHDLVLRLLPVAIFAMTLLLSTMMGTVFLLHGGRDPVFGWYALMLGIWAVHVGWVLVEWPPVDPEVWAIFSYWTLGWFVIASAVFVHRILDLNRPRVERTLLGWGGLGMLSFTVVWYLGWPVPEFRSYVWDPGIIAIGVYVVISLVLGARINRSVEVMALLIVACFLLCVGVHDFLKNHSDIIMQGGRLQFRFATGFALLAFAGILIRRFVQALDAAEVLNAELEDRIAEKAAELETQYARTRELEQRELLFQERRRLLGEMHDGLGGHIVHALAAAENEPKLAPMISPLKLALEDLRLIIDSLDPEESSFEAVFSSLRARLAHTCQSLGIQFSWKVDPLLEQLQLNAHEVLTLARIVQEAVTNVIKHAAGSRLSVDVNCSPATHRIEMTIADDGRGIQQRNGPGRGLTSMRSRATELGGEIEIRRLNPGTEVKLSWIPSAA